MSLGVGSQVPEDLDQVVAGRLEGLFRNQVSDSDAV